MQATTGRAPQLPEYIRVSKYAQHVPGESRREMWPEQTGRVFGMHRTRYADKLDRPAGGFGTLRDSIDRAETAMLRQDALGSQRVLQFGGTPTLRQNARVFNCISSFCDRPRFFQEAFHLLLCGCGVGFSVQRHHVARIPWISQPQGETQVHRIADSIEGWADSVGVLISSYMGGSTDCPFPEWRGVPVEFDASLVREKGSPISSGSKAPGPEPLLEALQRVRGVLEKALATRGSFARNWISGQMERMAKLYPIEAYDMTMFCADAVLAGGVRRSATIAIFSHDDEQMAGAKSGPNWRRDEPQRQRSNNSAALLRDSTGWDAFWHLFGKTRQYGEPGFYWTDDLDFMPNPCVEIGFWPVLAVTAANFSKITVLPGAVSGVRHQDNGMVHVSGWQACNLSTINGSKVRTILDFIMAAEAAAIMGTLQAGYTNFPYLGEVSEQIVRREALLGVSITGMMDNPEVFFNPANLERAAEVVKRTNEIIARAIGVRVAARSTCIKPEGTGSLMLDTFAAGVHVWPSRRGIRHVQASVMESPFIHFAKTNPHMVFRLSPTDPNYENTVVLGFPYEAPEGARVQSEISALEMLDLVKLVNTHWVEAGRRPEHCVREGIRHNVSNTVQVKEDEWEPVARFIYENRESFAGVSLMPDTGDKLYDLAPFTRVLNREEQIARHGLDNVRTAEELVYLTPLGDLGIWQACTAVASGDSVELIDAVSRAGSTDWFRDYALFLVKYDAAEEAVKDAELWQRYNRLRDGMQEVDWSTMDEMEDGVDFGQVLACSGGACTI